MAMRKRKRQQEVSSEIRRKIRHSTLSHPDQNRTAHRVATKEQLDFRTSRATAENTRAQRAMNAVQSKRTLLEQSAQRRTESAASRLRNVTQPFKPRSTARGFSVKKKNNAMFRAKVAGGVVAAFLLVVVVSGLLTSNTSSVLQVGTAGIVDSFSASFDTSQDEHRADVSSSVSWVGHFSNDLPEGFDDEIALSGDSNLAVSSDGRTIGFTMDVSVSDAMDSIRTSLEEKGWTYVPSNHDSVATFVKEEGLYRWLAVTCTAVGDSSSVVLVPGEVSADESKE